MSAQCLLCKTEKAQISGQMQIICTGWHLCPDVAVNKFLFCNVLFQTTFQYLFVPDKCLQVCLFFCKCHKLLFLENIFATFTSCCCGQFFWNNFIPANFSFCKFWQLFATDDYFQTLTPLKGFLATCYSVTKRLQQWVYLTWGIPKKIQSFSSQADPPP